MRSLILLIDDDEDFLEMASTFLTEEGWDVRKAKSGTEALDKLKKETYSVLLIDIKLPDFQGLDLLEKKEVAGNELRKIILTGHPSQNNAIEALKHGAHSYLIKPISSTELKEAIHIQLKERKRVLKEKYFSLNVES